jgi:hypothetical protein
MPEMPSTPELTSAQIAVEIGKCRQRQESAREHGRPLDEYGARLECDDLLVEWRRVHDIELLAEVSAG